MSEGSVFRTAETTQSNPLDNVPDVKPLPAPILSKSNENEPLYVYKQLNGHPYTAQHFDMKLNYESPTSEMQEQIESVDEWVLSKAKERNLSDAQSSYQEIVDGVLKQIGKSPNEKPQATFERIANAIEAYKRLEMAKLPTILDVKSMTPDEYKKTRA